MRDEFDPSQDSLTGELSQANPRLAPEFRAWLARHLADDDPGHGPRPSALRLRVAATIGSGGVLVALGALLSTGAL
jgi:hypothetical protein